MTKTQFKTRFLLSRMNKKRLNHNLALKPAAVLVPFVYRRNELFVILTQRAKHLRHHPGQVSFPGGRFEAQDQTLSQTALRETQEEIGIKAQQVEIFGTLGLYRTVSDYKVTPFIGFVDSDYELAIDNNEVAQVFEVPWQFLLQRQSHQCVTVHRRNKDHKVHFMPYQGQMIWGTTALIIHDLIRHFE